MANLTNKVTKKNLNCIEWRLKASGPSLVSEAFILHNVKCYFELIANKHEESYSGHWIYSLYLRSSEELQSFVDFIVLCGDVGTKDITPQKVWIKNINESIWRSEKYLIGQYVTFEVIIGANFTKNDKSVQISSNKDTCRLVESLSHDFGKLFDEGSNHDVEFTCGDQTLKAHKSILCCRSNVFASMLQSDMVEGKTGRINIQDIDATIFQQFLRCLYTGVLPELTVDSAFQFYEVSDKYGVESVKKQCAGFLTDNLSLENACEFLILSDRHGDADFKQNVIQFMIKEKMPYMGLQWANFCKENPILAVEVYELFCEQFRPA